jgi:hypothetical protein
MNFYANDTNNITNNSSDLWEIILIKIGSTWLLDTCYLYLMTILGFIGVILNILSLYVLFRINENHVIYKYYRVYTFNSILICTIIMLHFYTRTPRYFEFALTYGAGVYRCRILYGIYTFTLFGSLINISILLERLSLFKPKLEKYFKTKPYFVLFVALIITVIIQLPTYFFGEIRQYWEFKEAAKSYENAMHFNGYCKRASFLPTTFGRILLFIIPFIRDFLFLVIEIISTAALLHYFKEFFSKRKIIFKIPVVTSVASNSLQDSNQNSSKFSEVIRKFPLELKEKRNAKSKRIERNLQKMSLCFAALSVMANITSLVNSITFMIILNGMIYHEISFFNILFLSFKYQSNFFLFFYFNKKFRTFFTQS